MSLQTFLIATAIAGLGAAQYALMIHTMRDLLHRPRVRGGNKMAWALAILCVPIGGALLYGWMGPTSFKRRPSRAAHLQESLPRIATDRPVIPSSRKVTPIRAANTSSSRRATPYGAPASRSRPTARPAPQPSRIRRTGT